MRLESWQETCLLRVLYGRYKNRTLSYLREVERGDLHCREHIPLQVWRWARVGEVTQKSLGRRLLQQGVTQAWVKVMAQDSDG